MHIALVLCKQDLAGIFPSPPLLRRTAEVMSDGTNQTDDHISIGMTKYGCTNYDVLL